MADDDVISPLGSPTTNYGWTKPAVGADLDVWGGYLNTDLDGIDSTVKAVSNVANAALPSTGGTNTGLNDNRLINGDMRIDQRNNGASGTAAITYTVDRWKFSSSQAGKITWQQIAAGPGLAALGFGYYFSLTSSSAYVPIVTDSINFQQSIEADMISDLAWGTANAQPITLSFLVASSLSGMFSGSIRNYAATRSYPFTFSIPSGGAWNKIVIIIPGDTAGAWALSGNSGGLTLDFDLGCGTNLRGPANAWAAANYLGATGAVSVVATNGAYLYVTGVKLEIGSVATPFNRQSLAKSMADCQRYYQKLGGVAQGDVMLEGYSSVGGQSVSGTIGYNVMRAAPTAAIVGSPLVANVASTQLFPGLQALGMRLNATAAAYTWWNSTTSAFITLNAEL